MGTSTGQRSMAGPAPQRIVRSSAPLAVGRSSKMTASGELTTLHSFAGYPTDGAGPFAGLVQATNGDLYGTTNSGGDNGAPNGGDGTVFQITPGGALTTLYSFCSQGGTSCTDGADPQAALVQ